MTKGVFVAIEGPNGAGKSVISRGIADHWSSRGYQVVRVSEPSDSDLGDRVRRYRELAQHNITLACLVAADRYSNLVDSIRPLRDQGYIVISDRYVASNFVYQGIHGVREDFIIAINSFIDVPDLTVIVDVDYEVLRERLEERKSNSLSENLRVLKREVDAYAGIDHQLGRLGHPVVHIPNNGTVADIVSRISGLIEELL